MFIPIRDFEDRYEISHLGEIFSIAATRRRTDGVVRSFSRKRIATRVNDNGYIITTLYDGKNERIFRVHRLVLASFAYIPGCDNLDVNHKDGDRTNNHLDNLEWTTRSENIIHSFQVLGRISSTTGKFGAAHHRSIRILGIRDGVVVHTFDSLMDAQRFGFSAGPISRCISGKQKIHRGFHWCKA